MIERGLIPDSFLMLMLAIGLSFIASAVFFIGLNQVIRLWR
jgi:hypothetical protein